MKSKFNKGKIIGCVLVCEYEGGNGCGFPVNRGERTLREKRRGKTKGFFSIDESLKKKN